MRRSYGRTLGEVGQDKPVTAWMTDMDGVLVHEGRLVPGADAFIGRLRDSGTPFLVLTNNSIYTPRDLRYRLLRSGVKVPVDDLDAVRLISGGARFVATNPDPTGPSTEGVLPATGSVAASISRATGVEPYFVGKPNPLMMRAALNRLQPHSETTVMIGDRMDTDVVAGLEAGMRTVLVLTGITGEGDVERFPTARAGSWTRSPTCSPNSDGWRPGRGGGWLGAVDGVAEWSRAQRRVIVLVGGLSPAEAAVRVPSCPDWTVRDLLSHMVGLGADVVAGDEPDDHNAEWTARQVERRRDRDMPALVTEWEQVADPLRTWMGEHGVRPLFDVVIHEQDLRGALGVPGAQDIAPWAAVRERFAARFANRLAHLPPIALVGQRWRWDPPDGAEPEVVIEAPDYELARALLARRSAAQLHAWTTRGDVEPYLQAFTTLGPLPAADLSES